MTYKAIVKEMIRAEAKGWLESVLEQHLINYRFMDSGSVTEMYIDKEQDTVYWAVKVSLNMAVFGPDTVVKVGGTADDLLGICCSVIWDGNGNIIWMANKDTRGSLGITEFKLP